MSGGLAPSAGLHLGAAARTLPLMTATTVRLRALGSVLRVVLASCAVLAAVRCAAQSSYVAIAPLRMHEARSGSLKTGLLSELRYTKGEAGGTGLVYSMKGARLPNPLQRQADGLFRQLGVKQGVAYWGDDLLTFVVVRINLGPLVGNTDASIFAAGVVRSDDGQLASASLDDRVAAAVEMAARNLAPSVGASGVDEAMWKVLCAAGEKEWGVSGAPFELCIVDDSRAGHQRAFEVAQKLIAERRSFVGQMKFINEKVAEEARFQAARNATTLGLKSTGSNTNIGIYTDPKYRSPVSWYWKAWSRIDRGDYGDETGRLVREAEQALEYWKKFQSRSMPLLVLERQWEAFGSATWDGDDVVEQHLHVGEAYVGYLQGIYYSNVARQAAAGAPRETLEDRSASGFADWKVAVDQMPSDPVMDRAVGIALVQGIRGFRRDAKAAITQLEAAAERGSADALNWLGVLHDFYGAPQLDRVKAKAAYERAVAQGSLFAPQNLAVLHLFGAPGVAQSFDRYNALRLANDRNRPNVAWYGPRAPEATAQTRNGSELTAQVLGEPMPRVLVPNASTEPVEGRDVRLEVTYNVPKSVGLLALDFSDAVIAGQARMAVNHSQPVRVEGSGKETLWLGGNTYGYLVGNVKVRLLDESGKTELNSVTLPFAVRWDPGQLPAVSKERPAGPKLSAEQLKAIEAEFQQAQNLSAKREDAGAEKILDSLVARLPESGPVRLERAAARWNLGKHDAALADVEEAIRLKMSGARAHRLRGIFRVQKGDFAGALSDFNEALRRDPKNAELLGFRGAVQSDLGKPELALADFNASLELQPEQPEVVFQRARLHESRGDDTAAIADYSRVLQLDPQATGALLGRGRIRFNQQRWESALTDQRRALELDPQLAGAANAIGYTLLGRGELAAAFDALTKAVELAKENDSDVYAVLLRHVAARRLGRDDPRLAATWERWKDDPWAQALGKFLLGRASEEELEKLVAATTEAEQAKGRRCEMNYYIGVVRLVAGDKSTARLRFETAVSTKAAGFVEYVLAQAELKRL